MKRIFILWFKSFFSKKIFKILIGNVNKLFKKNQGLYEERYKHCMFCKKNIMYNSLGEICDICGCSLDAKLRVADERCALGKW